MSFSASVIGKSKASVRSAIALQIQRGDDEPMPPLGAEVIDVLDAALAQMLPEGPNDWNGLSVEIKVGSDPHSATVQMAIKRVRIL